MMAHDPIHENKSLGDTEGFREERHFMEAYDDEISSYGGERADIHTTCSVVKHCIKA